MADETANDIKKPVPGGLLGTLFEKLGVRSFMYQLGGRKAAVGGGAIGAITLIAQSNMADWPKAIACLAIAIVAASVSIGIAVEDKARPAGK
jgi:hypothetical protein